VNASGSTVTSVNTSASTGTNVISVDATKATYTGGAGVDAVTLTTANPTKDVSLGAEDDTLTLPSGTTTLTGTLSGGEGTNTLVMAAADAATASATTTFETKIDGFEKLSLGQAAAAVSVNLDNMDDIHYVISAGGASSNAISLLSGGGSGGGSESMSFQATTVPSGVTVGPLAGVTLTTTAQVTSADLISAFAGNVVAGITSSGSTTLTGALSASGTTLIETGANLGLSVAAGIANAAKTFTIPGTSGNLTLTNMTNAGTLELTGAATTTTVTMANATGTADSFNIVTKVDAANIIFGTVAVAGVETVNITATDITPVSPTTGAATISKATLVVSDAAAKTIVITGNSDLDLTAAGTVLTSVDASGLTGKLSFSSAVNNAVITGGSGADTLTATANGQTLIGGAGNDTLIATGDLTVLTGGAGKDVFNIGDKTTNVNSYATITDLSAGDAIKFGANTQKFLAAKVTLGDTAVFQDLANAAIANGATGDVAWFQFGGNTYAVQNVSGNTSFVNNSDIIVRITGLVDLSTATFSSSADTLFI
jgi:S-layer protein